MARRRGRGEKQGGSRLGDGGAIPPHPESRRRLDSLPILSPPILCPAELMPTDVSTGLPHPVASAWAWPLGGTSSDQRVGGGSTESVCSPAPCAPGCRQTLAAGPSPPLSLGAWHCPSPFSPAKQRLPDVAHTGMYHLPLWFFLNYVHILKVAPLLNCAQLPFLNESSVSCRFSESYKVYHWCISFLRPL